MVTAVKPEIKEPWTMSASSYQAKMGVHQPHIAEISPWQYANLSKRQKAVYDAKRAKEWDASAAIKQEWRNKVLAAHQEGKITLETPGISADAKSAITLGKIKEREVATEQALKDALDRNRIKTIDAVKVGDRVHDIMSRQYGTITKKFKNSVRLKLDEPLPSFRGQPLIEMTVNARALEWQSYNDVKAAVDKAITKAPRPVSNPKPPVVEKVKGLTMTKEAIKPMRKARDVTVGEYVIFTPPKGKEGGYLGREPWYGKDRPNQFNDASVEGKVIKINPKTVVIQNVSKGAWNYGHQYKIPHEAQATQDLSQYLNPAVKRLKQESPFAIDSFKRKNYPIVDVGQLSAAGKGKLQKLVSQGKVIKYQDYTFPKIKAGYAIAQKGMTAEEQRARESYRSLKAGSWRLAPSETYEKAKAQLSAQLRAFSLATRQSPKPPAAKPKAVPEETIGERARRVEAIRQTPKYIALKDEWLKVQEKFGVGSSQALSIRDQLVEMEEAKPPAVKPKAVPKVSAIAKVGVLDMGQKTTTPTGITAKKEGTDLIVLYREGEPIGNLQFERVGRDKSGVNLRWADSKTGDKNMIHFVGATEEGIMPKIDALVSKHITKEVIKPPVEPKRKVTVIKAPSKGRVTITEVRHAHSLRSPRAIAIDRSIQAKSVLGPDQYHRHLSHPERHDVRGVDTRGSKLRSTKKGRIYHTRVPGDTLLSRRPLGKVRKAKKKGKRG